MDAISIGRKLRKIREETGQPKTFVARQTGIPYRTICSYENGERVPSDRNKAKLAKHFGRTVDTIFFME